MSSYVDQAYSTSSFRKAIIRQLFGSSPSPETLKNFDKIVQARKLMHDNKIGHFVYYIRLEGRIKIGTSSNIKNRLRDLPWDTIELLEIGNEVEENLRHTQFAHLRIQGEWFKADQELLEFIDQRREELRTQQSEWFPELGPLPWGLGVRIPDSKGMQARCMKKYLQESLVDYPCP